MPLLRLRHCRALLACYAMPRCFTRTLLLFHAERDTHTRVCHMRMRRSVYELILRVYVALRQQRRAR